MGCRGDKAAKKKMRELRTRPLCLTSIARLHNLADAHSVGSAAAGGVALSQAGSDFGSTADFYEPKIAEQGSSRSRGSIL
uniref:Uncharacterized protein n=1 Tax=Parascaris equorum TaxID=6256 RepID=A0A914SCJ2_PAREQ